jgi:hypothetical protein
MAIVFPDIIGQTYVRLPNFKTLKSAQDSAADQARNLAGLVYRYQLGWTSLSDSDAAQMLTTLGNVGNEWSSMYFYEWDYHSTSYTYNVPSVGTPVLVTVPWTDTQTGWSVTYNSSPYGSVTLNRAVGPNGEDQLLTGILTLGTLVITATSARLQRVVRVESQQFSLKDRQNSANRWQGSVNLIQS